MPQNSYAGHIWPAGRQLDTAGLHNVHVETNCSRFSLATVCNNNNDDKVSF